MKFKNTFILLLVFAALLAAVLFLDKKGGDKDAAPAEKLVEVPSTDVVKASLKRGAETLTFVKDDKGEWRLTEPLEVPAEAMAVNGLVDGFADLRIDRVVEKEKADLQKYQIPQKEITLWLKGRTDPVKVLVGMENAIDATFYAQKEGDPRVVLIPSHYKSSLEKTLFDFRRKDIFGFETKDAEGIKLAAKDIRWEAKKKDGTWSLTSPLRAVAKDIKISNLLDSLANLRAKEFAAEAKTPEEMKKLGLDKPEYTVALTFPGAAEEIVFAFHKEADRTLATTSDSTKVVVPEADLLAELEKKADELRETKVAPFSTWQASKVAVKKGGLSLTVGKAPNDKWYFDAGQKEEADAAKVESFVRRIEALEAVEFIDKPGSPAETGLAAPQAEVTIWTKEAGEKPVERSVAVLVGSTDKDKKQAVVKNAGLAYLFRVDSAFLDEFPKDRKDWAVVPPEPEKKDEKK